MTSENKAEKPQEGKFDSPLLPSSFNLQSKISHAFLNLISYQREIQMIAMSGEVRRLAVNIQI